MTNILVTGSNGQLGSEIRELTNLYPGIQFYFTDIEELDLLNFDAVKAFFAANEIDCCINCAAYTAVDKAEEEEGLANKINHRAVENLAKLCAVNDTLLVHISTDYVFDGKHHRPYLETDIPTPDSIYGRSKLLGEGAVKRFAKYWIIIRTSWLYSSFGNNFVKTILRIGNERNEIKVVDDQVGTPTYAADLAEAILDIIDHDLEKVNKQIFHFSNEGVISWYDFAKAIIEESNFDCKVNPIPSIEFPSVANRPFYSVLSKEKIKKELNNEIPYWKDSLKKILKKLSDK